MYTVIYFRQNFENLSGFRSTETSYGFDIPKCRSQKIPESTTEVLVGRKKNLCQTNHFGLETRNSGFQKYEVSVKKPGISVRKPEVSVRKLEVSVQNPEVSGKFFEFEISVKVVFRNASVAETRNFELLCKSMQNAVKSTVTVIER
jgi:hypothetical protein